MLFPTVMSALARLGGKVAALPRIYRRKRYNARISRHMESLPPYLLQDIGLSDVTEIAAAVDRGHRPRLADRESRCPAMILPHAA